MPWATVFFPDHIRQLMNLETSLELKRASGFNMSSEAVNFLKAICEFRFLVARWRPKCFSPKMGILRMKLRPRMYMRGCFITLLALLGSVLGTPTLSPIDSEGIKRATDDMVANARQVANAPAAHQDDLSQRRIWLLRRHGLDLKAHPAFLRRGFQVFDLVNAAEGSAGLFDE